MLSTVVDRTEHASVTAVPSHPLRRVPGWATPVALWVAAAAVWWFAPAWGFCLAIAATSVVWRRLVSTHVAVLAACGAFVLGWVLLGLASSLPGNPLLETTSSWALAWVVVAIGVVVGGSALLSAVTGGITTPRRVTGASRMVFVPAALAVVSGLLDGVSVDRALRWIGYGTDPAVQLLLVQQMGREGALAYGLHLGSNGDMTQQVYPKGLHWLVTAVARPGIGGSDLSSVDAFTMDARTYTAFIWFAVAAALLAAAGAFLAAAQRWRLHRSLPVAAVLALLVFLVAPSQFGDVVIVQGGLGAAGAVAAYWSLWWALVARARPTALLTVVAAVLVVTSHAWQPLLPIAVLTAAGSVVAAARDLGLRRRITVGASAGWAILGVVVLAAMALPVTALVMADGASAAEIPGGMVTPPAWLVLLEIVGLLVAGALAFNRSGSRHLLVSAAGAVVGSALVWGAMLVAAHGQMTAYYPMKVVWFVSVFAWPLAAVLVAVLLRWSWRAASRLRRPLVRAWRLAPVKALAVGVTIILLSLTVPWVITFPTPVIAAAGGLSETTNGIGAGLLPPDAAGPYVPLRLEPTWDHSGVTEKIAAQVLTFRFGEPWNPLNQPVSSCAMLRMASTPVIVTGLPETEVASALRENGCVLSSYSVLTLSH